MPHHWDPLLFMLVDSCVWVLVRVLVQLNHQVVECVTVCGWLSLLCVLCWCDCVFVCVIV